jgi:hypothetical protein
MSLILNWLRRSIRRNSRMPGFYWRFYLLRFLKGILCLARLHLLHFYYNGQYQKYQFIVYNPNIKNLNHFRNHHDKNALFLVKSKEITEFSKNGLSTIPIEPLFFLTNCLGPIGILPFLNFFKGKTIILNSDYGLDEVTLVMVARFLKTKTLCLQHGLFPVMNKNDLDGFFCSQVLVKSIDQIEILRLTRYLGEISIAEDLFESYPAGNIQEWKKRGSPIVFVGSGFLANRNLRLSYIKLLQDIKNIFHDKTLIYRPHPREKIYIPLEIYSIFLIDDSDFSSLNEPSNYLYIGIKSTMLYEAVNCGRAVYVYESNDFPAYFNPGLLKTVNNLNDLAYEVTQIIDK